MLSKNPGLHALMYFGGSQLIASAVRRLYPHDAQWAWPARALTRAPLIVLWTYALQNRSAADEPKIDVLPSSANLREIAAGAMVGTFAYAGWLTIASHLRWIQIAAPHRTYADQAALAKTLAVLIPSDVVVAWHEELVFRGHGLAKAEEAVGEPAATAATVLAFALAHGPGWSNLAGNSAAGLALVSMRHLSNAIWLSVGYHFAWNAMQTSIFGPADDLPSMYPVRVVGPATWVGRPGSPEPGLLSTCIHLVVATGVALWTWRKGAARERSREWPRSST